MLCVRSCFLLFLCGFTQKIHSFCVYFLSPNLRRRCCLRRQAGHCFLVGEVAKYIKGASCFFGISILVFLIDLKNLSKFRKHISGSMKHSG